LVGKFEGKSIFRRPRKRLQINIKIQLHTIGF
jgi:hypothetical protein